MTICMQHEHESPWIGGEAAVGEQAERHVRSQVRHTRGLAVLILGLAFVGGLALAGSLCRLRKSAD